jgi:hypothetical protein
VSEHHGVRGALRRFVLGRRQGVSSVVYGTIVVMATVAAGSRGAETDVPNLAGVVAVTALVLWIAHVYSHTLAESLERGRRLDVAEFAAVARRELAIPYAAVAPVGTLVLAVVGVLEPQTAVWIALGFGVVTLGVQGARYAALERLGRAGTVTSVALNVALGLVIVGLEASIVH